MVSLLLVEDDSSLGATLQERLKLEGYLVDWAQTFSEACARLKQASREGAYNLAVIDVGLPDGNGLELAREIGDNGTAIVFLSALNSAEYRLEGFELGAYDYIPKPFHLKELLLRLERIFRRQEPPAKYQFAGFWLDLGARSVNFADGSRAYPQAKDFELLLFLIECAPQAASREQILRAAWREEKAPSRRSIDNTVVRLRQILKPCGQETIRSVRGVGYQWICPVCR